MKVPTRLWLNEKVLNVLENSQTVNLSINIACMVCDSRSFWIVFQSDVGDFIIQVRISSFDIIYYSGKTYKLMK